MSTETASVTVNDQDVPPGSADPLVFDLKGGVLGLASKRADLNLEVQTPQASCLSSGANEIQAGHDPDAGKSYFGVTAGSVTVLPTNPDMEAFTLVAGEGAELTQDAVKLLDIGFKTYLPCTQR